MLNSVMELVNGNAYLQRRGKGLSVNVLVEVGPTQFLLEIVDGNLQQCRRGPFTTPSCAFSVAAPQAQWQEYWREIPPPGSSDLFAMIKRGNLIVKGDLQPFMAHLEYFKRVLRAMRVVESSASNAETEGQGDAP